MGLWRASMNKILEENLNSLTKKKVGWIMEIMEMDKSSQDAKIRVKKALWTLLDELKQSINQVKVSNDINYNK